MSRVAASMIDRPVVVGPEGGSFAPGEHGWYDRIYADAAGDASKVPWALGRPCPSLVRWLNAKACERLRPGSRVVVVGCGLGDDVVELTDRGFDACGFDLSPTAIQWARDRFAAHADAFLVADGAEPPPRLRRRFDLVIEIHTLQSVPIERREAMARGIASLLHPRGCVWVQCRRSTEIAAADPRDTGAGLRGPPWALSEPELSQLMTSCGLRPLEPIEHLDDDGSSHPAMVGLFG